ncbi:hypothetical protein GLOIN_2v102803 [Rhizophagus irregularis DAOM 181602=DAOM 197198]|uniref:Uncharacterized protein n=1 Tax=Rhizophagus irregularis (strain DAOM 181602 / DAOM 197198 / MUCL 43194) TaxID=747089 RepID=A0A2P4PYY4_RHIID|nr:hypothetical protein GLOIN_2v102803 [Rhizophagus irregularis DAOM 181602=DAOM 197198]POG70605.1 hypothetical protein GLOIN_2v102803 [Rhizophagus irregularis DAOM 181602=DAOM 197198]|eukprot:XP_025177471.1 hypothetical protein GLOIN_2v102803 [Rhizophagus irregularis DAOM 181602=DAOM 197198]
MDEVSKDERTLSRGYGYSLKNTFAIKKNVFVRGVRYTILPAFSLQGIIAVDIMEGSCIKEIFKNFVISNVVSLGIVIIIIILLILPVIFIFFSCIRFLK